MEENVMTPNETPEEKKKEINVDSPTLCSVIPLMFVRVPFNPTLVAWESFDVESFQKNYDDLLQVRFAMITTKDPSELQKLQQLVDDSGKSMMDKLGFGEIDYTDFVKQINEENTRVYPSDYCQFLLLNDLITLMGWILTHLKYYKEFRKIMGVAEAVKLMRTVMFTGEVLDENKDIKVDDDGAELDENWDGSEDINAEMLRNKIIDDNNQFINNPDNMTDEDLRSIINSFNDDHSVSGLLEEY